MEGAWRVEEDIFSRTLPKLAEAMDALHGVSLGRKFWSVVLGPWYLHAVMAFHERWLCLQKALDLYRKACVIRLSPVSYQVPATCRQFFIACNQDAYNQQLYSQLAEHLGVFSQERGVSWALPRTAGAGGVVRRLVRKAACRVGAWGALHSNIVLVGVGLKLHELLRLQFIAGLKVGWLEVSPEDSALESSKMERSSRRDILRSAYEQAGFEDALGLLVSLNMPTAYVESFPQLQRYAENIVSRGRKVLVTSAGYVGSEAVKVLAASVKMRGGRIIIAQHGGMYGAALRCPNEIVERAAADEFWSFGWGAAELGVCPLPNPKLSRLYRLRHRRRNQAGTGDIVFVSNSVPRYQLRNWSSPLSARRGTDYFNLQILFLNSLAPSARGRVLILPYPADDGFGYREWMREQAPDVRLEERGTPYHGLLAQASLVVCDMNQTTLLEAMAADIPLIAFWRSRDYPLRDQAKDWYQRLRDVGVLHDAPEDAAEAVNSFWPDVVRWWDNAERRRACHSFAAHFALQDRNWLLQWGASIQLSAKDGPESGETI